MGGGSFLGMKAPSLSEMAGGVVEAFTLGIMDYNETDGLNPGGVTVDALKQVTGAAAQEDALKAQQEALNEQKKINQQNRNDEIERRRRNELTASRAASVVGNQSASFYPQNAAFGTTTETLGG